jgi:hypothetical protein
MDKTTINGAAISEVQEDFGKDDLVALMSVTRLVELAPILNDQQYTVFLNALMHYSIKVVGWTESKLVLTAEKVAAEPTSIPFSAYRLKVAEEFCERLMSACTDSGCPDGVNMADWIRQLAAPQQPAQSAEQDERAAVLSGRDVEELFLRWSEWTTELGEAISRKNIDGFVSDLRTLLAAHPVSGGKS